LCQFEWEHESEVFNSATIASNSKGSDPSSYPGKSDIFRESVEFSVSHEWILSELVESAVFVPSTALLGGDSFRESSHLCSTQDSISSAISPQTPSVHSIQPITSDINSFSSGNGTGIGDEQQEVNESSGKTLMIATVIMFHVLIVIGFYALFKEQNAARQMAELDDESTPIDGSSGNVDQVEYRVTGQTVERVPDNQDDFGEIAWECELEPEYDNCMEPPKLQENVRDEVREENDVGDQGEKVEENTTKNPIEGQESPEKVEEATVKEEEHPEKVEEPTVKEEVAEANPKKKVRIRKKRGGDTDAPKHRRRKVKPVA
jgi:hypothetical protein